MSTSESVAEKLEAVRKQFRENLPGKIDSINALVNKLSSEADDAIAEQLQREAHKLAGAGTTFGFSAVSKYAKQIEITVDDARKLTEFKQPLINNIIEYAAKLNEASRMPDTDFKTASENFLSVSSHKTQDSKLVYLVDDDKELNAHITTELGNFGYKVRGFSDTNGLTSVTELDPPDAIIIDLHFPDSILDGAETIQAFKQNTRNKSTPVIFISSDTTINSRLNAVRAGADAYLGKPIDIDQLINKLDKLTNTSPDDPYRVLIVDDTRSLSSFYKLTLESAGFNAMIQNDPFSIMASVESFDPELILLDIYMPGCTGTEIAEVLRQQEAYQSLPIVFLSSEKDIEKQLYAMSLGGDDFLTKPITGDHLIMSVKNRVSRYRTLRSYMVRDGLTGLYNHSHTKEQLETEVARSERNGTNFSFAMIDIDHFKSVNDTYGHMAGDRVIKSLSRLLQQRTRKSDFVGRFGGEEFAIILPDTDKENAAKLLDKIRTDFCSNVYRVNETEFSSSFSAGISDFKSHKNATSINDSADKALYTAKENGRNQVVTCD